MNEILDMHRELTKIMPKRVKEADFMEDLAIVDRKLLEGIVCGQYENDDDAHKSLFPEPSDFEVTIHRYRRSKSNILNGLIKEFLIVKFTPGSRSKYFLNVFSTKKDLVVAELMKLLGLQQPMRALALRILRKAPRFHMTYESMVAYNLLCSYYSTLGPKQKFEKYNSMRVKFFQLFVLEQEVTAVRKSLLAEFTSKSGIPAETVCEYRKHIDILREKSNELQETSRNIVRDFSVVESIICRFEGRFKEALEVHHQHKQFLLAHPDLITPLRIGSINLACLRICLHKRDFESGMQFAQQAEETFREGHSAWFHLLAAKLQLLFHTGQWNDAAALFRRVVRHSNFRASPLRRELWAIFEGFLRVFVEDRRALPANVTVHGEQFNILRLLQEFAVAHQDKTGLNIAVHIIHILHYLLHRKLELLDQRIAALQHYFNRHTRLRKDARFRRVRTFVQMLVAMQRAEFSSVVTAQKIEDKFRYLREFAPTSGNEAVADQIQSVQVEEIVPYHLIWEKVQTELQKIDDERLITRTFKTARPPQNRQQAQNSSHLDR